MNQQTPAAVPFVVPCAERVSKLPTYVSVSYTHLTLPTSDLV